MTAKDRVLAVLDQLPDDCTLDDVLYHLYVVQAVERGVADADARRMIPHEQVVSTLDREDNLTGRQEQDRQQKFAKAGRSRFSPSGSGSAWFCWSMSTRRNIMSGSICPARSTYPTGNYWRVFPLRPV